MYIPKYFKNEDLVAVKDFITANGFGILINQVDDMPWATHIPLILDKSNEGKDTLIGHISRANKQWKEFIHNKNVLVIFLGPHAYISSSWYDHENVPTWNYQAVHIYGIIKIIEGQLLKDKLAKLVDKYESGLDNPVSVDNMSPDFVAQEMAGIVGFEIEITQIQAASKLSQNRDENNYNRIIDGLYKKADFYSIEIAKLMEAKKRKK